MEERTVALYTYYAHLLCLQLLLQLLLRLSYITIWLRPHFTNES